MLPLHPNTRSVESLHRQHKFQPLQHQLLRFLKFSQGGLHITKILRVSKPCNQYRLCIPITTLVTCNLSLVLTKFIELLWIVEGEQLYQLKLCSFLMFRFAVTLLRFKSNKQCWNSTIFNRAMNFLDSFSYYDEAVEVQTY